MDWKVQIRARVKSNSELMPRTRLVWLDAPAIAELARPGQFVMVRCGEGHDPLLRRPLSIHRVDSTGGVALLFEVVGRGTSWLSERAPGDLVDLMGPLGSGFLVKPAAKNLLLVAGGIGIAPLAFLAEEAIGAGEDGDCASRSAERPHNSVRGLNCQMESRSSKPLKTVRKEGRAW